MATDLGKVGMVMKGDWNSSDTYEALDAVTYNNGLYIAKQAVPANTVPTNTTYWQPGVVVTNMFPTKITTTIESGASKTFGPQNTNDVYLNPTSSYFIMNTTNASSLLAWVQTRSSSVVNKVELGTITGFTLTIANSILTITNNTNYSMTITMYRFAS